MPRRIDIELTSALGDGSWTWRAAGAKQPKGVLDGSILPAGTSVGDEIKVEIEQEIDGITVLNVVHGREKQAPDLIELLPIEREFKPVVETRARRERGERSPRRDGDRRPRRDGRDGGDNRRGRGDGGRGDGAGRGGGRGDGGRGDGPGRDAGRGDAGRGDAGRGDAGRGDAGRREGGGDGRRDQRRERRGPSFTPPPEVPQRPKPKRLKPGKAHRSTVLNELPEEQRAIAELALQGLSAVRSRLKEENTKATAEGRPPMPEATVLKMAEELLPRLRVAEWRDRAEAAQRQVEHLDLRDLRSVVAAANDPMVARDETTRELAAELQKALTTKQEQELLLWFGDVDAALAVGRVIRALRLSSQPPKAGVPFPTDIAQRLVDSTNAALAPMDGPDRWVAILEAAAFSPIRTLVRPARKPDTVSDELNVTLRRLAPALPLVAELFEIEVAPDASMPKPQRPGPRQRKDKDEPARRREPRQTTGDAKAQRAQKAPKVPPPPPKADTTQDTPVTDEPVTEDAAAVTAPDSAVPDVPSADTAVADTADTDEPTADTDEPTADTAVADEPTADAPVADAAAPDEPVTEEAAAVTAPDTAVPDVPSADTAVADTADTDEPNVTDEPTTDEPTADAPVADAAAPDETVAAEVAESSSAEVAEQAAADTPDDEQDTTS